MKRLALLVVLLALTAACGNKASQSSLVSGPTPVDAALIVPDIYQFDATQLGRMTLTNTDATAMDYTFIVWRHFSDDNQVNKAQATYRLAPGETRDPYRWSAGRVRRQGTIAKLCPWESRPSRMPIPSPCPTSGTIRGMRLERFGSSARADAAAAANRILRVCPGGAPHPHRRPLSLRHPPSRRRRPSLRHRANSGEGVAPKRDARQGHPASASLR